MSHEDKGQILNIRGSHQYKPQTLNNHADFVFIASGAMPSCQYEMCASQNLVVTTTTTYDLTRTGLLKDCH